MSDSGEFLSEFGEEKRRSKSESLLATNRACLQTILRQGALEPATTKIAWRLNFAQFRLVLLKFLKSDFLYFYFEFWEAFGSIIFVLLA